MGQKIGLNVAGSEAFPSEAGRMNSRSRCCTVILGQRHMAESSVSFRFHCVHHGMAYAT